MQKLKMFTVTLTESSTNFNNKKENCRYFLFYFWAVLKAPDKVMFSTGVAQLVQTSYGKHILLTPASSTIPVSTTAIPG